MGSQTVSKPVHKFNPEAQGWHRAQSIEQVDVWVNGNTREELEEYRFAANTEIDLQWEVDSYHFRHNSPYLVASKYFRQDVSDGMCSSLHQGHLFIQRIPIRLSKIKDIPYPDILHMYSQALRGFDELHQQLGPFHISEEMVGINNEGVVKVWVNSDFGKSRPNHALGVSGFTEAGMARKIVKMINLNTFHESLPGEVLGFFIQREPQTLKAAIKALEEYTVVYRSEIPQRMNCVLEAGKHRNQPNSFVATFGNNPTLNTHEANRQQPRRVVVLNPSYASRQPTFTNNIPQMPSTPMRRSTDMILYSSQVANTEVTQTKPAMTRPQSSRTPNLVASHSIPLFTTPPQLTSFPHPNNVVQFRTQPINHPPTLKEPLHRQVQFTTPASSAIIKPNSVLARPESGTNLFKSKVEPLTFTRTASATKLRGSHYAMTGPNPNNMVSPQSPTTPPDQPVFGNNQNPPMTRMVQVNMQRNIDRRPISVERPKSTSTPKAVIHIFSTPSPTFESKTPAPHVTSVNNTPIQSLKKHEPSNLKPRCTFDRISSINSKYLSLSKGRYQPVASTPLDTQHSPPQQTIMGPLLTNPPSPMFTHPTQMSHMFTPPSTHRIDCPPSRTTEDFTNNIKEEKQQYSIRVNKPFEALAEVKEETRVSDSRWNNESRAEDPPGDILGSRYISSRQRPPEVNHSYKTNFDNTYKPFISITPPNYSYQFNETLLPPSFKQIPTHQQREKPDWSNFALNDYFSSETTYVSEQVILERPQVENPRPYFGDERGQVSRVEERYEGSVDVELMEDLQRIRNNVPLT